MNKIEKYKNIIIMKSFSLFLLIFLAKFIVAQDIRDSITGNYYCDIERSEYYPPHTWTTVWYHDTIRISKDSIFSDKIWINDSVFCNDPVFINLPCQYYETMDSTFHFSNSFYGIQSSGTFFTSIDSLYFTNSANGIFGGYGYIRYYYYGKKIIPTTINDFELKNNKDFVIYPNPVKNQINIMPNHQVIYSILIYNVYGQLIYENKTSGQIEIYAENYKSGIYFIRLYCNDNNFQYKLIKE